MCRCTSRCSLVLFFTGLFLVAATYLVNRSVSFDGLLVLSKNQSERWVACPAEPSGFFSVFQHRLPAALISFDNPSVALSLWKPDTICRAQKLPFKVILKDIDLLGQRPDKNVIEIEQASGTEKVEIQPGKSLTTSEGSILIKRIQPWIGLIQNAAGSPFVMIRIEENDAGWSPPIFLSSGMASCPIPDIKIEFGAFSNESLARKFVSEQVLFKEARWGVRESGKTHWFENVVPGAGVKTSTGTEYTLLEIHGVDDPLSMPYIVVEKKEDERSEVLQVTPTRNSENNHVIFEFFSYTAVLRLGTWRDDIVLIAVYTPNNVATEQLLEKTVIFENEIMPRRRLKVRLEKVLMSALPITSEEANVKALVIQVPNGNEEVIREGTSITVGQVRLAYRREIPPPCARYHLRIRFSDKRPSKEFWLAPGERQRINNWWLIHDQPDLGSADIAVLRVRCGLPLFYLVVGGIGCIVGLLGFFVNRYHRVVSHSANPSLEVNSSS